jgi:DNA replication and repair protein RecF
VVILFDECVSHFDFHHRVVLFQQIRLLHEEKSYKGSLQAFMTGTDADLFAPLKGQAQFYHVSPSLLQKG